jgi:hypothetical protein
LQYAISVAEDSSPERSEAILLHQLQDTSGTASNSEPSQTRGKAKSGKRTQAQANWKGFASLQKLHNIAVLLRNSNSHYQSWKRSAEIALGIDNETRWNSWYHVIDVIIKKKPAAVNWLMENIEHVDPNMLEKDDWDMLQKLHAFLQPFLQGTLLTEKRLSSLNLVVVVMDTLLKHFTKAKVCF